MTRFELRAATQMLQSTGELARTFQRLLIKSFIWVGSHEFGVLLAVTVIAGGAWLFAVIADEVLEGGTQAFDRSLLSAIRSAGDHVPLVGPSAVQECARDVTALGGIPVLTLVTVIAAGLLFLGGKRRMAYFVCASVAGGFLVSLALKGFFQRIRPDIVPQLVDVFGSSFPSTHCMMSSLNVFHVGCPARTIPRSVTTQGVRSACGGVFNIHSCHKPKLSRSALAHGCAGWLDGRRILGSAVLARRLVASGPSILEAEVERELKREPKNMWDNQGHGCSAVQLAK